MRAEGALLDGKEIAWERGVVSVSSSRQDGGRSGVEGLYKYWTRKMAYGGVDKSDKVQLAAHRGASRLGVCATGCQVCSTPASRRRGFQILLRHGMNQQQRAKSGSKTGIAGVGVRCERATTLNLNTTARLDEKCKTHSPFAQSPTCLTPPPKARCGTHPLVLGLDREHDRHPTSLCPVRIRRNYLYIEPVAPARPIGQFHWFSPVSAWPSRHLVRSSCCGATTCE